MKNYLRIALAFLTVFCVAIPTTSFARTNQEIDSRQNSSDMASARFLEVAAAVSSLMAQFHFDPSIQSDPDYIATEKRVEQHAENAASQSEFVSGFNAIWRDGPFSHVRLSVAKSSAADTAAYFDNYRVGGGGAVLGWDDDIAVLKVKTMMGLDTIEEIDAAFVQIVERNARGLIVDLRENEGGAFAVRPLLGHVIAKPVDGGAFVSRRWASGHDGYPNRREVEGVSPWQGWSVTSFWRDLQNMELIRMQLTPMAPIYEGPVYVLVDKKTASAAELAADAFAASGRAIIIGEKTAGEMLSQTMFDLPHGLQIALPIGDYYAFYSGRIEGNGVTPHIVVAADHAMDSALKLLGR